MMRDFLEFAFPFRNAFIYTAMAISIPGICLYISECVVILRHTNFRNTFYALFIARAVPDMIYVLNSYYGYRLPTIFGAILLPFYRKLPNFTLDLYFFISNYTFQADNLAMAFLLFNRFTAIAFPWAYDKFWHYFFPLAIFAIFSLPIVFTYDTFTMVATLNTSENSTASDQNWTSFHIFEHSEGTYLDHSTLVNAIFSIAFLLTCVSINIATFIAYRLQKRALSGGNAVDNNGPQMLTNKAASSEGMERKLFLYALYTFIGHMVITFLMIAIWWYNRADDSLALASLYAKYPLIVDIGTILLPSGLILWASPTFRQQWIVDMVPQRIASKFNWEGHKGADGGGRIIRLSRNNVVMVQPTTMTTGTSTFPQLQQQQQPSSSARTLANQNQLLMRGSIVAIT